ncbi:MAG: 30S ribosomal protein S18 [Epsilonproteobacteria bacterium]|nr:MAG: 30S ribosomal protein S18 [Campylobacterota bacterium]RLA66884.1 MAG: 30S ribosomal protein S18 [Campylobacterota bacterium]
MIYELAVVLKDGSGDTGVDSVTKTLKEVVAQNGGEVLIEDNWGVLTFAQPSSDGIKRGSYLYFIFSAGNEANTELNRRFNIDESVLKYMVLKLGENSESEKLVKEYKTPYSNSHKGSVTDGTSDESGMDMEKDRKKFAKRKTCWFSAKDVKADWKDPKTYSWLVNEFGKISPARVSGISRKHQRFANSAIKRARNLGISSCLSRRNAE